MSGGLISLSSTFNYLHANQSTRRDQELMLWIFFMVGFKDLCSDRQREHGLFLEGVYKIELDTKTEYERF
jgi:hypothetical protein